MTDDTNAGVPDNDVVTEQRILGFSGRKGSGKNTAANFLIGSELVALGVVQGGFMINEQGQLDVADLLGNRGHEGIYDPFRKDIEFLLFADEHVSPYIKAYSFADLLKEEVCIKILGLTHEQCYGTDEQKNSLTHLRWENMPGVVVNESAAKEANEIIRGRLGEYYRKSSDFVYHKPGQMSGREVLQYVGTEIFRKMYGDVWVDALVRQIKYENSQFAIITDVRFPNEVEGLQKVGGKVVRLTRNPFDDTHESETCLDKDKYDWAKFDYLLDNKDMSIGEQNKATVDMMVEFGWPTHLKDTEGAKS